MAQLVDAFLGRLVVGLVDNGDSSYHLHNLVVGVDTLGFGVDTLGFEADTLGFEVDTLGFGVGTLTVAGSLEHMLEAGHPLALTSSRVKNKYKESTKSKSSSVIS